MTNVSFARKFSAALCKGFGSSGNLLVKAESGSAQPGSGAPVSTQPREIGSENEKVHPEGSPRSRCRKCLGPLGRRHCTGDHTVRQHQLHRFHVVWNVIAGRPPGRLERQDEFVPELRHRNVLRELELWGAHACLVWRRERSSFDHKWPRSRRELERSNQFSFVTSRAGRTLRGALRTILLAAAVSVTLAGCVAPSSDTAISPDNDARALLDQRSGEIVMPLSDYDLIDTNRDIETLNHAFRIFIGECMATRGLAYTADQFGDESRVVDDRPFGLWFEPNARTFGFGFPPSNVDAALDADRTAGGTLWSNAEQECTATAESDPEVQKFMPTNEDLNSSLVSTIRTEAYRMASADPVWQEARETWWACLRDEGLEPLTGANDWNTTQVSPVSVGGDGKPVWSEESIQVAFTQARCNNETGLTQTLGNREAAYQAALIVKNQAALNEWKELKQRRLRAASDYIQSHG